MNSFGQADSDYVIAVCFLAPVAILLSIFLCIYALCPNKRRLNWYEHSLLEESKTQTTVEQSAVKVTDDSRWKAERGIIGKSEDADKVREGIRRTSHLNNRGRTRKKVRFQPVTSVVEVLKGLKKLTTRFKSQGNSEPNVENGRKTEWIVCSRKRIGSSPSSPIHEPMEEKFWVPPAVLDRKRAQSLVPAVHNDSEDDISSGTVTPASVGGLREFSYTFQSTPLISSDGLPSPVGHVNRQRRASMQDAIDFRKIDSTLYERRSLRRQQSSASIEEDPLGSIHFSLDYNNETCLLTVYLIEAENLISREFSGTSDPYCKVCLLPDQRTQLQSKIHRKTTHPIFDEEFIFEIDPDNLPLSSLELLIYDYDQFSRHECMGQVVIPFENMDFTKRQNLWKPIAKKETSCDLIYGDLIFSLGYLSSAERLTVVVMKARNLRHSEENKVTMDPYVKILLNPGNGKKQKKKKTSTQHNVSNPVWNEALMFNLPKNCLQHSSLDILVYHDNKIGNDEILGKVRISQESTGDEKIHWDEMVNCKSAVARWHALTL